jgi:pimeloyl-ACP methyl ester carboxylesterase
MTSQGDRPTTIPPPPTSAWPPGETHAFAHADDGTRLFVRTKDRTEHEGFEPREGEAKRATHVFLCDGILCDGFIWKYLWEDLATVAPLVHWHYRGHGRSAPPVDSDRIDITAHADDLMAVRQHAGNPPCVLIGHSMGCQVALECYRRYPSNVEGLVLVCGSFGKVTSTFRGVPILDLILPKLLDAVIKHGDVARAIWSRIPPDVVLKLALKAGDVDPEKIHPEDLMPYLQHMTHVDLSMFLRMLRAAGEHSAEDFLGDVNVPTLVVAGERDTFTPAFLAESMASSIPGAEILVVRHGTHVSAIEQPEVVGERVVRFLRDRVVGPRKAARAR